MINVCIAGATGWAGRALVAGVIEADDLLLRSAVTRSAAGADFGRALGGEAPGVPVYGSVVDHASAAKPDAPSGTSRKLAERLAQVRTPVVERHLGRERSSRSASCSSASG